MRTFFVYILQCHDHSFYVGVTNNYELRLQQHQDGIDKKCYTYSRRPVRLMHVEEFQTAFEAIRREKQIKRWSRAKKAALVAGNEQLLSTLSKSKSKIRHGSAGSP